MKPVERTWEDKLCAIWSLRFSPAGEADTAPLPVVVVTERKAQDPTEMGSWNLPVAVDHQPIRKEIT